MHTLELTAHNITVTLKAGFMGPDLLVRLTGGAAHIGAVALATPRQSLNNPGRVSADVSVLTASGHKEDLLARAVALKLAAGLNVKVAVAAGLHWDNASSVQIAAVEKLAVDLAEMLLKRMEPTVKD